MSVRVVRAGALLLALAVALVAPGCQPAVAPQSAETSVTVGEILANPQRYTGRSVVVDGQVDRLVAERVIALRSATTAREVLAIVTNQSLEEVDAVIPGEVLHVSGTVQAMSREALRKVERQLGIQLDEERLLNLANQAPFLVAEKVSK